MNELIKKVENWSTDKYLHLADSSKQMLKVVEEVGEVAAALARDNQEELKDGIGDVIVTLIILAQQNKMSLEECLEQAWNEIADRKGEMVNGVFVKESDLQKRDGPDGDYVNGYYVRNIPDDERWAGELD